MSTVHMRGSSAKAPFLRCLRGVSIHFSMAIVLLSLVMLTLCRFSCRSWLGVREHAW